jgi:hypothetical protein
MFRCSMVRFVFLASRKRGITTDVSNRLAIPRTLPPKSLCISLVRSLCWRWIGVGSLVSWVGMNLQTRRAAIFG